MKSETPKKLTAKQKLFVAEYLKDMNASKACVRAGYSERTAEVKGSQLMSIPHIKQAIDVAMAERIKRCRIDSDSVLLKWWEIANADYNELTQLKRVNCRYCWGHEHNYQWTTIEYQQACRDAEQNAQPSPECLGGLGYNSNRPPHPDCPECHGDGLEKVYFADTTKLSHSAKLVYQGVKQSKFGIEVVTVDRMKALDNVAKHLGMFKDKVEVTGADGKPIQQELIQLTPEQVIERMKSLDDEY